MAYLRGENPIEATEEALEDYRKAGKIASKVRSAVPRILKPGRKILEICEEIERMIIELGGKPAFPCNIGINEVTAHYTSPIKSQKVVPENSIVKVDLGVHINGHIADTAITLAFDPIFESMIMAAEDGLEVAIKNIEAGKKVSDIGHLIENSILNHGYKPIRNLTGHKIERFSLHCGKALPNISQMDGSKIEVGEVYAIEPFATFTNSSGFVRDKKEAYIFRFNREKGAKSKNVIKMLRLIKRDFFNLPFTPRWLTNYYSTEELEKIFNEARLLKCIAPYYVLIEESNNPVAQAEHTVLVNDDGCEVITF